MIHGWWMAFRPKTLTAALVPIVVGTALVGSTGAEIKWDLSLWALAAAIFIQIGTNLFNDAIDFKKGADSEDRVGPQRVTQSGVFTSRQVMWAGVLSFVFASLCGLPLVVHGGWPIVAIGLISLACGYLYTGGPFPLAYQGLGDVFVILFFGVLAVGGVFYLHTFNLSWDALIAGLQVGFLATVLIVINNLRDIHQDKFVNKKTLPVRFGKTFGRWEILLLMLMTFSCSLYWIYQNKLWASVIPLLTLPFALRLVRDIFRTEPSSEYNQFLAKAALVHLLFGGFLGLGLFLQ